MNNKKIPKYWDYCDRSSCSGSKYENKKTPAEITTPTIIFLGPSFNFLSLTRVHKIATKRIDIILHDLNAITIGKLVMAVAQVYVIVDMKIIAPQMSEFFSGILVFCGKVLLYRLPISQVTKVGTITRIALSGSTYLAPV